MRTFTAVAALVWLYTATLSAAPISKIPNIGKNYDLGVTKYSIFVASDEAGHLLLKEKDQSFTATGPGAFQEFIRNKLRSLPVHPLVGNENAAYKVTVGTDWFVEYQGEETFKLEKTATGWKLPDAILNLELDYGGCEVYLPTATSLRVETTDGKYLRYTVGGPNTTDHNDFGTACDPLGLKTLLEKDGFVSFGREIGSKAHPIKSIEVGEGDRFVVFNGDGDPVKWSNTLPSFFRLSKPLKLSIAVHGDAIELCITGEGAQSVSVEETTDLKTWVPAYSLSSPPRLSSDGDERRQSVVNKDGCVRFYRLRSSDQAQKL